MARGTLQFGICKTYFFFCSIKHVFWHFSRRAKCEICSKLTMKTPEYIKLMIKSKMKTPLTPFMVSLLLTLDTFHFVLQSIYC